MDIYLQDQNQGCVLLESRFKNYQVMAGVKPRRSLPAVRIIPVYWIVRKIIFVSLVKFRDYQRGDLIK